MPNAPASLAPLWVVGAYLAAVLVFSSFSGRRLQASSRDYFVASRSLGPFLLLMSVFGTTMTAFSMVGSTGKAFESGIGGYGLMASSSGIVHSLVFFLVGIKLWAVGKRYDYVTQIQYFRDRFGSNRLGYVLFPILVALVIPYLLIGVVGANSVIRGVTVGMFPDTFPGQLDPLTGERVFVGAVPPWISGLVICGVVLFYVLLGGVRATAWANAVQTLLFMSVGVLAFWLIASKLGGLPAATENVGRRAPQLLVREPTIPHLQFVTYALVPLSVGMFPHVFQHWLTARSAKTFRTTVVAYPLCILVLWLPCVLIGIWAAGIGIEAPGGNSNGVLAKMVAQLEDPVLTGLLTAGILAAIMSSLDSQLVCLGTMFTHDVVLHAAGPGRFTDRQQVALGRLFTAVIAAATYALSLAPPPNIFDLAVWCFSGFTALFPLVFAAIYWRRVTAAGAFASIAVAAGTWIWLFADGLVAPALAGERPSEDYLVWGVMPVTIMFAAASAALVLVSLCTAPPPAARVARFFPAPAGAGGGLAGGGR